MKIQRYSMPLAIQLPVSTKTSMFALLFSCVLLTSTLYAKEISYTYNEKGQITTVDGPRVDVQDITTYQYDQQGYRESVTNAQGHIYQFKDYNGHELPERVVDINGVTSLLQYSPRGWLTSLTVLSPSGSSLQDSITQYSYSATGLLTKTTLPNGSIINYHYDEAQRLVKISNNKGEQINYTLDLAGNQLNTQIKGSSGDLTYTAGQVFDELSRVMTMIGSKGETTSIEYDKYGNEVAVTNPRGYVTNSTYNDFNRKTSTSRIGSNSSITYDDYNRLTQIYTGEGQYTHYEYDNFDNVIEVRSLSTGVSNYIYDEAANKVNYEDANGHTINYSYDSINRLIKVNYENAPDENITYEYDATLWCPQVSISSICGSTKNYGVGKLTTIKNANYTTYFRYDHQGNLTGKTQVTNDPVSNKLHPVEYSYNANSQLTHIIYPSGLAVHYSRDDQGRVLHVNYSKPGEIQRSIASNISYLPFGPIKSYHAGNYLTNIFTYDKSYRILTKKTGAVLDLNFSYDENSNIIEIDNRASDKNSNIINLLTAQGKTVTDQHTYNYDEIDRVSNYENNRGIETFTYNGISSQTNRVFKGILTEPLSKTFLTPTTFTYNKANRLTAMTRENEKAEYNYNAKGLRISKTTTLADNKTTTFYVYDEDGLLLNESKADGSDSKDYVYLNGEPVALITLSNTYFYHNDHLGTPRVITDELKNIVWASDYTAYGKAKITTHQITNNLRFPGQYFDTETGYHYNWHRYYDPSLGRYLRSDPIGLEGGINTYAYVGGNPLSRIDPNGLEVLVNAYPNDQGGFNFTAHDDQGSKTISGSFNNETTNINQIRPGAYTVSPRPELPSTFKNWLFNRNENAGNPTISNTDDWNTIRYPTDGSITTGAQFHEGRNGTSSGTSLACMVSDRKTNNALNGMFNKNYNSGGVKLYIFPAGWIGP